MDPLARRELQLLLAQLARGERASFDRAFVLLWPVVRAFCGRALQPADAEDAAQAALLRVFERSSELDPARPALPWVLGIAAFECRTLRKRALRRKETGDTPDAGGPLAGTPDPESAAIDAGLRAAAAELLGELRPADAETLLLLSRGERPGLSPATFRKRAQRAIDRFRTAWRARHGTD